MQNKNISIGFTDLIKNQVSIVFKSADEGIYNKGYQNSPSGRTQLQSECDQDTVTKVFETWGDTPTVEDYIPEVLPDPPPPEPTPEQLAIAELSIAQAMAQQQNEMAIAELSIMIAGGMSNV